jgi:orotate phosphoribosyltransferase
MIEDLVTKATSLLEAIPAIEQHDLVIKDAVVLLDYGKGGGKNLADKGYTLHAFMTVRELVDIMFAEGRIDAPKHKQTLEFLDS